MARKQKELIKAATIATAIDKITGKVLGWAVKSNSSSKYYHILMEVIDGVRVFFCDCEAHLWGCAECCHIKAIQEVLVAKAELMQAQGEEAVAEAEKIVTAQPASAEQGELPMVVRLCDSNNTVYVVANGQYELVFLSDLKTVCPNGYREDPDGAIELFEMMHPNVKEVTCKRAPQFSAPTFTNRENYALTSNAGFSLLK